MKITTITVKAGRVFNNPHESYSNLQPSVEMTAEVEHCDDPIAVAKELQQKAEKLVEEHKQSLLQSIEELAETARLNMQIESIRENLEISRANLADLELRRQKLKQPELLSAPAE